MKIPKLMLITDGTLSSNPLALQKVMAICQGGVIALQLREKQLKTRRLLKLAAKFRMTASDRMFLSINERIDIALAVKADGVHLSEEGISPQIPKKLNPSLVVGVSVHSLNRGFHAEQEGADYVLFGPIFDTPSKRAYGAPQGLKKLETLARALSIPILAVGGITPLKAKRCAEAGAYGVAAIRAFTHAENLEAITNDFLKELNEEKDSRVTIHC